MNSIGIVRKIDELGRLVIPIELRKAMGLDAGSELQLFVEGESIILRLAET